MDERGKGISVDFTIQVCREGEPWRVAVEKRDYPRRRMARHNDSSCPERKGVM